MAENSEETRLKTPKTAVRLTSNLKHDKKIQQDENLENYDSEVQMYARAHSGPRLAD